AVADDVELAGRGAGRSNRAVHGVAAALAEAEVVLAGAALVGVAFKRHARARELAQVCGMAGDLGLEFRLDLALVEIEVHHALAQAGIAVQAVDGVLAAVVLGLRSGLLRSGFRRGWLHNPVATSKRYAGDGRRQDDTNREFHFLASLSDVDWKK